MSRKYLLLGVGILCALAIGYFIVTKKKPVQTDNKITVGVLSWPGCGAMYVGQEKGFFKEEGIDLDIKFIENFDSRRAALISGQIDVDYTTIDQLLIYNEAGFNAQIFGLSDMSNGGDGIISKNTIKSIADLKGKTVAYGEASPSEFVLRYLLKQNNVPITDVKLKPVADAQIAGNSIIAEQVDAAVTFEPFLSDSKKNKNLHILSSSKEYPELIPGLMIGNKKDIERRKELYNKFMKAWYKSAQYLLDNPTESFKIISTKMNMPLNDLEGIMSNIKIATIQDNESAYNLNKPNNLYSLTKMINQFWVESGIIKKTFKETELINNLK